MASCINPNLPEFKALERVYGTKLAERLVIGYSMNVLNQSAEEEYYYPSKKEVSNWLTKSSKEIVNNVTLALSVNPNMSVDAINSLLSGVVHKYGGSHYVTKGYTSSDILAQKVIAENVIYKTNLDIMETLQERFPNVFTLTKTDAGKATKVNITPVLSTEESNILKERAGEIHMFNRINYHADPEVFKTEKAKMVAEALGRKFQKAFGMDYKVITRDEAIEILQNSKTPYENQTAFFFNNTVYFIEGHFNYYNVLHEFAHPLIKGIAKNNPTLFRNLYSQLAATAMGQTVIGYVKHRYPNLLENEDRFMEEALVTALEIDATQKLNETLEDDSAFKRFMTNLIYAIKQVLRKLTKSVDLKKLDSGTTLEQLSDMMLNDDFEIIELGLDPMDFAEFNVDDVKSLGKDVEKLIDELKNTDAQSLIDAINRTYAEAVFQINTLNNTPGRLKEELKGRDGVAILRSLRDWLKEYQTTDVSKVSEEDVLKAVAEQQLEFRERALALINSINQIDVFSKRINEILKDMDSKGTFMNMEGFRKVQYYAQFLKRQQIYIDEIITGLGLDENNKLVEKLSVIGTVINNSLKITKKQEFEFINTFIADQAAGMQDHVSQKMRSNITRILKAENFTDQEIANFIKDVEENPNPRQFGLENSSLPRMPKASKYIIEELKNYYAKRLVHSDITDLLSGKKGDIGFGAAMLTPYGNIDDPIGAFVRFTKAQLATSEQKSLRQANEIANALGDHLKAVGYNPNDTGKLGQMLLTVDKVPVRDENGNFKEFEVYTVINRFKQWRADKGKLEYELEQARESGDRAKILEATRNLAEFNEKYMHRKYIDDVYNIQKIWTKDNQVLDPRTGKTITVSAEVAQKAYIERQMLMNRMNTFSSSPFTEEDDLVEITESDALKMEYEELYNVYEKDGAFKQGEELEKVLIRRLYRDVSGKFRESVTNYDRVQRDLDHFVKSTLAAKGISPDEEPMEGESINRFQKEMNRFIRKNFRTAYTPEFWREKNRIIGQLIDLSNQYPNPISAEMAELFKQRNVFVKMTTDKNGTTNGLRLNTAQISKVKEIEDKIVKLSNDFDRKSGLSKEDSARLKELENRIIATSGKPNFTSAEQSEYDRLTNVKNEFGIPPLVFKQQWDLIKQLMELRQVEPTDYYIEAFNAALGSMEIDEITKENADEWINSASVLEAKANSTKFAEWFDRNHYKKESFYNGQKTIKYYRIKVWNVEIPTNPDHYQATELINPATGKPMIIPGVPVNKYSYSRVRDEFRTGYDPTTGKVNLRVGIEVDNRGNFLPRADAKDRKYINEEYEQLERENGSRFKLIEAYTKSLLSVQEGKPRASKLYLDLPRFRQRERLEYAQSGKAKEDFKEKAEGILSSVKATFKAAQDDQERGFNANIDAMLITTDLQGEPISSIPVRGLYRLERTEVSQDVLRGLADYMYSLNAQEALMEAEPVAKALSNVLNDPKNAIKDISKVSKNLKAGSKITQFLTEKNNRRAEAMDYFIEKVFYGQAQNQFAEEHPFITKISTKLMGSAHRAFSALDIPAALKNKYGILFQSLIESAGGKYIDHKSLALGRVWSYQVMTELSVRGIYERGPKSLELQIVERFDPMTGKTKTDFGRSTSRTFIKDFLEGTWMYDPRKFMEVQEGINLFAAMMYKKMIDQVQPDGTVKQIRYIDAFELDDQKQIRLKKGIDPEYNFEPVTHEMTADDTLESIAKQYNTTVEKLMELNKIKTIDAFEPGDKISISSNTKFIDFRLKIQGLGKKLNGMVDEVDSPQANKYLGFRLFTFYRKFATTMFLNRFQMDTSKDNFGGEVYDWDLNETTQGYYITAVKSMYKLIRDAKTYWPIMKDEEKLAIRKVLVEGLYIAVLAFVATFIFGYDPGDEERFDKMRDREDKYGYLGWAANHMLYQVIMIRKENEAFIPIPGIGLNEWLEYTDSTSIVTGPTLDLYSKLLMDIVYRITGSDKAFYKREVGPYSWQQEDSWKFWNHLGSVFGWKGKTPAPIWAIKKAEMFENLK